MGRCKKVYCYECKPKCKKIKKCKCSCDCDAWDCNNCCKNYNNCNNYNPCCNNNNNCCNNYAASAIINPTTFATTSATPLTFSNATNIPVNPNGIVIGPSTIIFMNPGIYNVTGNFAVTNQSGTATNIIITPIILSGGATINPTNTTYTSIASGATFNGFFNFIVNVTVPNTQIQFNLTTTSVPLSLISGQINIVKIC